MFRSKRHGSCMAAPSFWCVLTGPSCGEGTRFQKTSIRCLQQSPATEARSGQQRGKEHPMIKPWIFEFLPELGDQNLEPNPGDVAALFARYLDLWVRDEELGFE